MRFMTVRDLRSKAAQIWRALPEEGEIVVTLSGKPIAILSSVSGDTLEDSLSILRRARALAAVTRIQTRSAASATARMTPEEVDAEIAAGRRDRPPA